ncbi:hypothetical protein [Streptomyces sp. CB01881]|uniref:hypothetical protein n=1 Tax=Streptomyces sp. CB01881 TaxID=2078691 RepID=UPI000CDC02C1|nr:hypothetical protein [Streptomyces sp. CB01881]AUY49087.1 hypothetical protein C2142_09200 [Streptomyces sp. CB01881]TYC77579.1 hypothetical protein EH183_09200 [Streptomyces sp. CB01881]
MRSIETLLTGNGQADIAGLREVDADELARYVVDRGHPWWHRRACAVALAGRVPQRWEAELLARVEDTGDVAGVRTALLDLLADRADLLPWLWHEDRRRDRSFGMPEAILKARGRLGDLTASEELATLAASPWPRWREVGEAGLDALTARYGAAVVMAGLGDGRPEDRVFRVRMRRRAGEDVTDALADPDRAVAHLAQSLLTDADRLRGHLGEAPTTEAKLWAAYALHRLTGDAAETRAVYESLGRPRVEVAGLDDELRRAIVHEYGHDCERQSDPRWRIEALCTEPPVRLGPGGQDERLRRATAALTAADLAPEPPVPAGRHSHQGDGTYHVIDCADGELFISTLGRFATGDGDDCTARRALESAGFRWIDAATGSIRVAGLFVYYFGRREPLTVETLLFHWQD